MQDLPPENIWLARETLEALLPELPSRLTWGLTYDEINFFDSEIEKPSREAFETKLQELIDAKPWKEIREERNKRISACDWTQLPNVPLPGAKKYEWETYRQALRDITQTTEDPSNPVWPIQPSP